MSEKCGYTWNHWNHWNHHPIFGFSILNQPLVDFMLPPWTPDHVGPRHQLGQELFQLALQVLHLWQEQHQAMSLVGPLGHREELRPPGGLLLAMGEPVDGDSLGQNSLFFFGKTRRCPKILGFSVFQILVLHRTLESQ